MELNSSCSYHASARHLQMTLKSRFDLRNNLCLLASWVVWQPSEINVVEVEEVK